MAAIPDKIQAVLEFLERDGGPEASLGALRVRDDGTVEPRPAGPLAFRFSCHGIPVACVADQADGTGRLTLDAVIGRVPYTVEGRAARERLLATVRRRRGMISTDGREVRVRERMPIGLPLSPVQLITGLANFMLRLEPEIAALADCLPPSRRAAA